VIEGKNVVREAECSTNNVLSRPWVGSVGSYIIWHGTHQAWE